MEVMGVKKVCKFEKSRNWWFSDQHSDPENKPFKKPNTSIVSA